MNSLWLSSRRLLPPADILVLAGNIISLENGALPEHPFLDWCSDNFNRIYIVPGDLEVRGRPLDVSDLGGTPLGSGESGGCSPGGGESCGCSPAGNEFGGGTLGDHSPDSGESWDCSPGGGESGGCSPRGGEPGGWPSGGVCRRVRDNIYVITGRSVKFDSGEEVFFASDPKWSAEWLRAALSESDAKKKIVVSHHVPSVDLLGVLAPDHWIFGGSGSNRDDWRRIQKRTASGCTETVLHTNQLGIVRAFHRPSFCPDDVIVL